VLRDIISSGGIPCVRLTRIFRQASASLIVTNAHRINAGEPPLVPEAGANTDFFYIERTTPEAAQKTIVELVQSRIPRRFGLDPVRDIQVLTPMHRGAAGSLALNEALQGALNPVGPAIQRGGRTFRVGDKVMQLRNDYDRNVWNGDVGVVASIDREEDSLVVSYDGTERGGAAARDVLYDGASLDELTLAYACTIHKSQGSEYPAVVIPLLTAHFVMLSKNLLYTAVTRGKRLVVLVADSRAVALALAADRKDERRTGLGWRLAARLGLRA
jgi:exodeoxyribonuclease V alpha subunit